MSSATTELEWRRLSKTGTHLVISREPPESMELMDMTETQMFKDVRRKLDVLEKIASDLMTSRNGGGGHCNKCN